MKTSCSDYSKRYIILNTIAKTGRLSNRELGMGLSNVLRIVNHWEDIGLVEMVKEGRSNKITLTEKGKEYLNYFKDISKYSDF